MLKCWDSDPEDRPSFAKIGSNISKDLQAMEEYLDVSLADKIPVDGTGQLTLVRGSFCLLIIYSTISCSNILLHL